MADPRIAKLANAIPERNFDAVAALPDGTNILCSANEAGIRNRLNAPARYIRYLAPSGVVDSADKMILMTTVFLTGNDERHDFIRSTRVNENLRVFLEFVLPTTEAVLGQLDQAEAQRRVIADLQAMFFPTPPAADGQARAFNTDWHEIWHANQGGNDVRPPLMIAADAAFRWLSTYVIQGAAADVPNLNGHLASIAACYMETDVRSRSEPFNRRLYEIAIAMSKMGTIHEDKLDKIRQQVIEEKRINLRMSVEEIASLWKEIVAVVKTTRVSIPQLLRALHGMIRMEDDLRIHLTLRQSADTGVAGVVVISEAMRAFPTSQAWRYAWLELESEMTAYVMAGRALARNAYIAYGGSADTELVKNTQFPNLYYLARKMLQELGGDHNMKKLLYSGIVTKKVKIDLLIRKLREAMENDFDLDDYQFPEGHNITNFCEDLAQILRST